jgi:hypothetical protein
VILKPIQALREKPGSSPRDAICRAVQPSGDIDVLQSIGRIQDHPRALHRPKRQRDRARPPLKLDSLLGEEFDHIRAGPGHDT